MDELVVQAEIGSRIFTMRKKQILIDRDLAELYKVETKVLNQAVKRNIKKFPSDFLFQLNNDEKNELVTNCDRFKKLKHSSVNPYGLIRIGYFFNSPTSDIYRCYSICGLVG